MVRAVIVYVFLPIALRLLGNRPFAQLSRFDIVLLLVLASAIQNAMNAGDNSVVAGLVLVITLMALNHLLHRLVYRNRRLEQLVEGSPQVLIHNGRIVPAVADGASLTDEDIRAELRKTGTPISRTCAGPSSRRTVTSA